MSDLEAIAPGTDLATSFAAGAPREGWLIVDNRYHGSLVKTCYLCAACLADLSDLRVHHVRRCPYCEAALPFLLDGVERGHVDLEGWWPYDLLRARFVNWCQWVGSGDEPWVLDEDGTRSQRLTSCRRFDGHPGGHDFRRGRERPPRNPLRGET